MYTVLMSLSPPSNFPELEQDKATDISPKVQQRSQRARVQPLAVAQRFIGPEGSVSGLTVRGHLAARETGHRETGFEYTPRLSQGEKDFHEMKRVAEAKSTTETVVANIRMDLWGLEVLFQTYLVRFITVTETKVSQSPSLDF